MTEDDLGLRYAKWIIKRFNER